MATKPAAEKSAAPKYRTLPRDEPPMRVTMQKLMRSLSIEKQKSVTDERKDPFNLLKEDLGRMESRCDSKGKTNSRSLFGRLLY